MQKTRKVLLDLYIKMELLTRIPDSIVHFTALV